MQNKWSAFLDRDHDAPDVKLALKSAKILNDTKKKFVKQLTFEAEPAEYVRALSAYISDKQQEE